MPPLPRPDLRSLVPLFLAGALMPAMRSAGAQVPDVDLGSSDIAMKLELPTGDEDFEAPASEEDIREFMNLANCTCGDKNFRVEFRLDPVPSTPLPSAAEEVDLWVGTSCAQEDTAEQERLCNQVDGFAEVDDLLMVPTREISVRDLIGVNGDGPCQQEEGQDRSVYAIVDENSDGFDEGVDYQNSLAIKTDTDPPPEPLDIRGNGTEGGLEISWDLPTSREEDIRYFQVLCSRVDDEGNTQGLGSVEQLYLTANDVCPGGPDDGVCPRLPSGSTERIVQGGGDAGTADAGTGADAGAGDDAGPPAGECATGVPEPLANLDPAYLCGQADGMASSVEATGLANGVAYNVVLLVIDWSRNVTAIYIDEPLTPRPVKDFWEDYKERGGNAEGGCNVGQAGLGGGLVIALGVALAFGLRRGSRRRRGGGAGAALLLVLGLAPGAASAQPWWEEGFEDPVQAEGPTQPNWGLEIKLAPYVPDVDSEAGISSGGSGPFEDMFGDGPFLMSAITLDRYILYPLGQLGVSATVGFMTRSANAFELDEDGNTVDDDMNGKPDRSGGDSNTFRLFPASLGVVYRYTQLDDKLRVPIVPYGRLGLSYYTWWITGPSGDTAEAPTDDCPDIEDGDCEGDRARGGSLGWQATAGIAIRAERIDPDAEVSLRTELGIEHAGLVFEFTYAKVDGFGASKKMAVGDATFFGGINFEF
jgi:hypothetical protein